MCVPINHEVLNKMKEYMIPEEYAKVEKEEYDRASTEAFAAQEEADHAWRD